MMSFDQYLLGCEQLTQGQQSSGWFSIGVGGSEHAYQLVLAKDIKAAQYFAERAVLGWEKHADQTPSWQYPYPYFYVQALAISGQTAVGVTRVPLVPADPDLQNYRIRLLRLKIRYALYCR